LAGVTKLGAAINGRTSVVFNPRVRIQSTTASGGHETSVKLRGMKEGAMAADRVELRN